MSSPLQLVADSLKTDGRMRAEIASRRANDVASREGVANATVKAHEGAILTQLAAGGGGGATTNDWRRAPGLVMEDKLRELQDSVRAASTRLLQQHTHFLGDSEEQAAKRLQSSLTRVHQDMAAESEEEPQPQQAAPAGGLASQLATAQAQVDFLHAELGRQQHLNIALERENQRMRLQSDRNGGDTEYLWARLVEAQAESSSARIALAEARERIDKLEAEVADLSHDAEERADRSMKDRERQEAAAAGGGAEAQAAGGAGAAPLTLGTGMTAAQAVAIAGDVAAGMTLAVATEAAGYSADWPGGPGAGAGGPAGGAAAAAGAAPPVATLSGLRLPDERTYRLVVTRLRRLLDSETRKARLAQAQLNKEREGRSAGVRLLVTAVEEARQALQARRAAALRGAADGPSLFRGARVVDPPIPKDERQAILASVLAQEAVLAALQPVLFPTLPDGRPVTKGAVTAAKEAMAKTLLKQ